MLALVAGPCGAAPSRPVRTAQEIGIENDFARIVFDAHTGELTSLRNVARSDEYLKDRTGGTGGPFRIYSDFRGEFDFHSQGSITRTAAPPEAIAGAITRPSAPFRLESTTFQRSGGGLAIMLEYTDEAARWRAHVEAWLPDASGASEWRMRLANLRPHPAVFMAGFPSVSGFRLGSNGATNMQTTLREGGGITPAWTKSGGIYGNGGQMTMQWHALFDRPAGVSFGLIVADPDLRNKWFRIVKPSIEVLYFPPESLDPGAEWRSPVTRLIIGDGDWKPVARAYSEWFGAHFRMAERPAWLENVDSWMGMWFAKKGGTLPPGGCGATAICLDDFSELAGNYRERPVDVHEYAFHTRGSARDAGVHTDGDNFLREDLGGAPALKKGIEAVHQLGYRYAFYIEGYIVHESSELAKSGKAARWSVMHKDGSITGSYTKAGFYQMCPGAAEWQDYLAAAAVRLVSETGADAIRLDSLGFYFLPCYNPAHHHDTPFGYNRWLQQLLEKVSRAVRAVNPNAALTTEAPADFYSQWFHGALHQTWTIGRELPPMRIALPGYRPLNYQMAGPIYGSLTGFPGGTFGYEGNTPDLRAQDENWRGMRYGVAATLWRGEVADRDPVPSLADVTCRQFFGPKYSVVVCARVADTTEWNFPKQIKLVSEHPAYSVRMSDVRGATEAVLYDLEKNTAAPVPLNGAQLNISGTNWFMAVLREPGGPVPVSMEPVADLRAGESRKLLVKAVGPRTKTGPPLRATLSARGLRFASGDASATVNVPGEVTLVTNEGTPPGRYEVMIDGEGIIGMKRFVVVHPR
jgi:hypothetical protein